MHFHFLPLPLLFALKSIAIYLPTTRFEVADATFQGV